MIDCTEHNFEKDMPHGKESPKPTDDQHNLNSECSFLKNAEEIDRDLQETFFSVQNTRLYDDLRDKTQRIITKNGKITQTEKCEMLINAMRKYLKLENTKEAKNHSLLKKIIIICVILIMIVCYIYKIENAEPF